MRPQRALVARAARDGSPRSAGVARPWPRRCRRRSRRRSGRCRWRSTRPGGRPAALAVPAPRDAERAHRARRGRNGGAPTPRSPSHLRALRRAARRARHARRPAAARGAAAPATRRPRRSGRARGPRSLPPQWRCAPGCGRSTSRAPGSASRSSSRRWRCSSRSPPRATSRLPRSPGAGDNAAGVGAAVALHEELTRNPPDALAPALLLFGAGEGGPPAVRAHLRRERLDRAASSSSSSGRPEAAPPFTRPAHPQVRATCERAAEALGGAARAPLRHSMRQPRPAGASCPLRGSARSTPTASRPRSRQPSDTLERLDPAASEAVLDFALACVDALDARRCSR